MSLDDWLKNGWLRSHTTSPNEISARLSAADRDLAVSADTRNEDWRLVIAYNAALYFAATALAAEGYEAAKGPGHHERVIESLRFTLGVDKETIKTCNRFREKRNISDYEQAGMITKKEADEMIELAKMLRKRLIGWLFSNHPELVKD